MNSRAPSKARATPPAATRPSSLRTLPPPLPSSLSNSDAPNPETTPHSSAARANQLTAAPTPPPAPAPPAQYSSAPHQAKYQTLPSETRDTARTKKSPASTAISRTPRSSLYSPAQNSS